MIKNILIVIVLFNFAFCFSALYKISHIKLNVSLTGKTSKLPIQIITNDPLAHLANGKIPVPQYGEEYRKWLRVSVKIIEDGRIGSGTIVYADEYAVYVQTCGHIWGDMTKSVSIKEMKKVQEKCKVVVYYDKDNKFLEPKVYEAEVLYYNNLGGPGSGHDVGLLKFIPDRDFDYFPVAPSFFPVGKDYVLHSTGCDGGTETAHYKVQVLKISSESFPHIVTTQNSPRPGRSGGGLFTETYLVGICWGTSDKTGIGNGYFIPLQTIRYYNELNGFGWLNDVNQDLARKIPIKDHTNQNTNFPENYIPLPEDF